MRMPQIVIEQTHAQIGIRTEPPKQELRQPRAEMEIRQEPAILEIHTTPGVMLIDQTEARADIDLKSVFRRIEEYAQLGRAAALEATARIAQEGDMLRAIEHSGNPIAAIAQEKGNPPPADFNVTFLPRFGSVKFDYQPAKLDINWTVRGFSMDVKTHPPEHRYTPGKAEVYLLQKNSIRFDVAGLYVDTHF